MDPRILVLAGLAGAAICWLYLALPELPALWAWLRSTARSAFRVGRVRVELAQAGLGWIRAEHWIAGRWALVVIAGLLGYLVVGLAVVGVVSAIVAHHLAGVTLEARRRKVEARRQRALLDAIRHGISVMSRGGTATQMLNSLAGSGPVLTRELFEELTPVVAAKTGTMIDGLVRVRERLADPLFDDFALALTLHWKIGGKLVGALEALVSDWEETLRLQREAKVLRSGIEASVLLLTVLPYVFLVMMHFIAPELLLPFTRPAGVAVFAGAAGWMVIGYRVLQRMAAPPRTARMVYREANL